MMIRPLGDWLCCIPPANETGERTTDGGVIIPANMVNTNAPWHGVVVKAGPGAKTEDQSDDIPMRCKEGDRIVFSRFVALETIIDGYTVRMVRDRDVIMVLDPAVPSQAVPEDN